jgi:hypothetical protein
MIASSELLRCSSATFQVLNPEHFGAIPSEYTIASDDLGWIDFSFSKMDRLANSHDAFFETIATSEELELAIDQPEIDDECRLLDELEELIGVLQSTQATSKLTTQYSSDSESPSHPKHIPCKTVQTRQT